MKLVLIAVLNQLKNHPLLTYAYDSAYLAEDSYELMEQDRFPFYNVVPGDERIELGPDGTSKNELERHVYPVVIQFATASLEFNVSILGDDNSETFRVGILDFSNNILSAILFDKTLNGVVDGIIPDNKSIPKDFIKDSKTGMFISRGEITVEFFKDVEIS